MGIRDLHNGCPTSREPVVTAPAKPIAQNSDIRYLGKLLGDVIRAYGGERLFERIESIRASSVDQGLLREMATARPFFRATLDNMEMVLAKSNMAIARRYATLVEDGSLAEPRPRHGV